LSELVLLLLNTDRLQQFEDFCQSLFYFYQILTAFNRNRTSSVKNLQIVGRWSEFGRSGTCSDKNLQIVAGGQYLVEVEQALTKIFKLLNNLKIFVRACSTSTKY
jgi:hypothetical protein